ncbi:unnamed protein product [Effrenium voratum]|nr:unnamed protein product [Effrenium voratum]
MGDQLTWKGVEGSLACAVQFSVLTKEEAAKVEKDILLKAAAEVKESRHFSELKDMGMTLEDAAREYLDSQVILSPLDVLAQGAALKLFEVSEDLWKQLAPKKT